MHNSSLKNCFWMPRKNKACERETDVRISFFHSEYPRFEREVPQNAEENIEILSIITNIF